MKPGEFYWADLPEAGPHLIIVVSREELNRGNRIQATPITSKHFERRSRLPTCVAFNAGEHELTENCVAQCDLTGPIALDLLIDADAGPVGRLPDDVFRELIVAIGYVMDSSCEPN